jgi:hypothetical protein
MPFHDIVVLLYCSPVLSLSIYMSPCTTSDNTICVMLSWLAHTDALVAYKNKNNVVCTASSGSKIFMISGNCGELHEGSSVTVI